MELVEEIRAELARRIDPEYREGSRRFFKETIDPWGVRSADLKDVEVLAYRLLKPLTLSERYAVFEEMWRGGKFEEGVMVSHLARKFKREFGIKEFKIFERWVDQYVSNWAHCDGVSSWLLSACIDNDPALREKLLSWTRSKNRWKRRASAVSFLQEAKRGRSVDSIFDVCARLEKDTDVMVQKGIGWLLKETYPERPEETLEFFRHHSFPRLVVRYAAEKMSRADRTELGLTGSERNSRQPE
jgi:3-methyladenine DNA glycosylase AlkD